MKYKNISTRIGRKGVKQDDFHSNLFIAVADMYWDMIDVDISPSEARSLSATSGSYFAPIIT